MRKLIPILVLFLPLVCVSQVCDSLRLLKQTVYAFTPKDLTEATTDAKNRELDSFWNVAMKNPLQAAPCLKKMIEDEPADSFFNFDAASLLAQIDTVGAYLPTVTLGLSKCNPEELELYSYLRLCLYLNYKKQDVGALAQKLISIPDARIVLTGHFTTLNAIDASIFLYNNMPTETAENHLKKAIESGNDTAKHNAAVVLNLLSTDSGDAFLSALIANKQLAENTVKFIEKDRKMFTVKPGGSISRAKILEHLNDAPYNFDKEFFGFAGNDKLIASACRQLNKDDITKIREARAKSIPGLSDEALHEYFSITSILMTVRNKPVK